MSTLTEEQLVNALVAVLELTAEWDEQHPSTLSPFGEHATQVLDAIGKAIK